MGVRQEEILKIIEEQKIGIVAADLRNNKVGTNFTELIPNDFSNVRFIDMYKIYEDIFDRVPMTLVRYDWFLQNVSVSTHKTYDF